MRTSASQSTPCLGSEHPTVLPSVQTDASLPVLTPAESGGLAPCFPGVDQADIAILHALKRSAPRLCWLYDLEADTNMTRKTIGKRLVYLIDHRLACRPKGLRSGVTITAAGIALLQALLHQDDTSITR